ncbi:MAG: sigma-54 dependent transcriptional regulator [Thermodesulfobacteriota bacterium]
MHTVLIVDDEPNYRLILAELLRDEGFEVLTAASGEAALGVAREADLDMVVTDMRMPGMDGIDLMKAIKSMDRDLPVMIMTAFGEVDKAVEAMRAGAYHYLVKPFKNDELVVNVRKAIELFGLVRENRRLLAELRDRYGFANLVGKTPAMLAVYHLIEKVAPTPATVLITGESGTGKELVARAIHFHSNRKDAPFVSVNCAALADSLLESELFGHEKGAFTGAVALRKGRFELADSGTLFLDEVGDMSAALQTKLLRALQERSFERVGGTRSLTVDVRVVAATNKDLKDEVGRGSFREDLYYRLNVVHIQLPPLRERADDIPLLVAHLLAKHTRIMGRPGLTVAPEALRYLMSLPWEGNVRELENTVERAVILASGSTIQKEDLQPAGGEAPPRSDWSAGPDLDRLLPSHVPLPDVLATVEEHLIRRALANAGQVQAHAAHELGIAKSLLQYKMKKYGIAKRS